MSDTSQGPGWWQASDGKWYPPQGAAATPPPPPSAPTGAPTIPEAPPVPPPVPPGPTPYGPPGGPAAPKQGMHGCLKALLIGGAIAVVLGILAVVAIAVTAKNVADEVNASIERGDFEDLTDTTGDFDSSDVTGSDADFCRNVLELDRHINGDVGDTQREVEAHFEGYDELIEETESLIPSDIEDEGDVFVGFHRDILTIVEDADFDPQDIDGDAINDLSTSDVADAARAVNAHCGFQNPPDLEE